MRRRQLGKVENYSIEPMGGFDRETIIHFSPPPGVSRHMRTLCGCENGGYRPADDDAAVDCGDCLAIVAWFRGKGTP